MSKDDAFQLMLKPLKDMLPEVEMYGAHARNPPAKRAARVRAALIREVIQSAEEVE
jgi:hypothetical protein